MKDQQSRDVQVWIARLLRTGMIVSMLIVTAGLVAYLYSNGKMAVSYRQFDSSRLFEPAAFFNALRQGESTAIIQLGVLLLMATPLARLILSLWAFLKQGDRLYALLSLLVLCIILFSMFLEAVA
jgi:uncharacterized membrane protein